MTTFAKILRKLKLAPLFNFQVAVSENQSKTKIPLRGLMGYSNLNIPEPWMSSLLNHLHELTKGSEGVFVDVGANIGQTLIKWRNITSDYPYVGFEPNPSCVQYLNELIKANSYKNVELYPFGVSDTAGVLTLEFYCDQDVDSSASLVKGFRPEQTVYRRMHVPVMPVSAVTISKRISILKIDVEGGELEVLRAFEEKIATDRPFVVTEILPVYSSDNQFRLGRQCEVEALFRRNEYVSLRIVRDANDQMHSLEVIGNIGIHGDVNASDYLWVPKELELSVRRAFE